LHPRINGIIAASIYLARKGKGILGFYENESKICFCQNDLNAIFPRVQYEKFLQGINYE